jgi:hypothetical protein
MNLDSGDIVHITGDTGEGVGMDTPPGDGTGIITGVGEIMVMAEDILIFMVTIGNKLQKWKNSQQETNLNLSLALKKRKVECKLRGTL